jgi:hypothetical protein
MIILLLQSSNEDNFQRVTLTHVISQIKMESVVFVREPNSENDEPALQVFLQVVSWMLIESVLVSWPVLCRKAVSSALLLGHTGTVIVCKNFSKDSLLIEI